MSESTINLTDEEKKQMRLKRLGGIGQKMGAISGIANSILPSRSEYQGEYGGLSQSLDSGYDALAEGASSFGPIGQLVGGIMKAGAAVNKLTGSIGGGTDGMCVCAGTKVFKKNGEIINIEKLQKEDGIIGWDTHKIVPQSIHDFVEPRYKQCVEIVLKNGNSLKCSVDHPILNLAFDNWEFKRADKLEVGDVVGLAPNVDYWGNTDNHNAYTIGYSLKDDLYNEKSIKDIRKFNKISTCKFLAGLFDSKGNIDTENSIVLIMSNANLLKEISLHLHKLGIFSIFKTLSKHKYALKIKDSIYTFYKEIPVKKLSCNLSEFNNETLSEPIKCEVASITHIGVQIVYNLQADYDNTYLANGIITHNTKTDSILGSSFLGLTPIGLINGFGGKRAKKFGIDQDTLSSTNGSYDALLGNAQSSANVSGKKFGLFSSGARRKANRLIDATSIQQNRARDIIQEGSISQNLAQSMATINANKYALQLQGGYDPDDVRIGRHGMSLELLDKARRIIKAQKGKKLNPLESYYKNRPKDWETIPDSGKPSYQEWIKDFNPDFINPDYDLETAYNNLPYDVMQRHKFAVNQKTREDQDYYLKYHDDNGYFPFHTSSVVPLQGTEDYIFLKKGKEDTNPEVHFETDTYYDGTNGLKDTHDLVYEKDRYYYRKKKSKQNTPQHKNGGSIIELSNESIIELVNPLDIPEFQNGGTMTKKNRSLAELIEYAKKANPRFVQRFSEPPRGINFIDDEGKESTGSHYMEWCTNNKNEAIIYPRIQEVDNELKFFNSDDAYNRALEKNNYLKMTPEEAATFFAEDPEYVTAYKSGWPKFFNKLQNGGSINVIPDGALHARKHNMNLEGITEKGIPVVSEKENGKIEQQAEIEKEEVIFRLEVTQKLEELEKKYYSEESSQKEKDEYALEAGKLMIKELLHNTKDNAGLL